MAPEQFEIHIANLYKKKGYEIQMTPKSYDYGVDIIATNKDESIAIQVKMYKTRLVNYKDIMYLYAGKDYYNCNKGVLITSGICHPLAILMADKLNIQINENHTIVFPPFNLESGNVVPINVGFDNVWETYIKPLKGQTILTATREGNTILDVTDDYIKRKSSLGRISSIEKAIFKTIYYYLLEKKSITREEINTEYPSRGSSIITAILGLLPFVELTTKPKATLTLKNN